MQDFRKLKVWQRAHALALHVYAKTADFPKAEVFGVTSQTRRAAVSTAANIAEGSGRSGDKEFARFLYVALGSASELEYFSILIADLGLLKRPRSDKNWRRRRRDQANAQRSHRKSPDSTTSDS